MLSMTGRCELDCQHSGGVGSSVSSVGVHRWLMFFCLIISLAGLALPSSADENSENLDIALALADVLRAARSEIASQQPLINDATIEDKGLDGAHLLEQVRARLEATDNARLLSLSIDTRQGALIQAQFESIREVIDENQSVFNRKNVGFKGFVPAVFARLVNERFGEKAGDLAKVKVTAPLDLVRNRKSRPDSWESSVLNERFQSDGWKKGALYSEMVEVGSSTAYRVMVPEYYGADCLSCHGSPKGDLDITGYPKEGGAVGELAGSLSITLFQ